MSTIIRKRNSIEYTVHGAYALFSDPITRIGGEKFSYQIPTYEAIKGITESIYWKPSIIWFVDAIRVMRKIQTESKGIKPLQMNGIYPSLKDPEKEKEYSISELSFYTYLKDVEYHVIAHFEFNKNYRQLSSDWNEHKHHNIARRAVIQGGRRDIFMGTRECQAYVEPCRFEDGTGFYDDYGEIEFGSMFHGFDYPNETGKCEMNTRFWRAKMVDGVVLFPSPDECPQDMRRFVRNMDMKMFTNQINYTGIDHDKSLEQLAKEAEV
jgi:CRISPR-associated protein Cas5d